MVVVVAVRAARRISSDRLSWLLVALGLALLVAGDLVYDLATHPFGQSSGYPYADAVYLSAYPALAAGLGRLAVRRRGGREATIDGAIVSIAATAVMWEYAIEPVLRSSSGPFGERLVTVAYPVMDVVLLVAAIYALFTMPRRVPSTVLLFGAVALQLA